MTLVDSPLVTDEDIRRGSPARRAAVVIALRHYVAALARHRRTAIPALLLPGIGNIFVFFLPPLIVGRVVTRFAGDPDVTAAELTPYVIQFGGVLLLGELLWRVGMHCLNRAGGYGIEDLYVDGMNELLAKDAAFFHDNFAGSLTKRVISFASRFNEFIDTLAFSVFANLVPLSFASVVLWRYSPVLVAALLGLITLTLLLLLPFIRRRQVLVDAREAAWARISGHVADTIANMEAVRTFAAEPREASEHQERVAEQRRLAVHSWDYANTRIEALASPMSVLTNTVGLVLALRLGGGRVSAEALVVTFAYFTQATRVLFEFNQTYRRLESALTEAAQFTELLAVEPTVLDPPDAEPLAPVGSSVVFDRVSFSYRDSEPLFTDLDLVVEGGTRVGLVGRSGGGKTTLTRLLLRLMDVDGGRILVGGQDIARLRQADLRTMISYVPQDPAMFHRTMRDNIAFGRPDASDDDVLAAAEAAYVTDFLPSLPRGLDTLVGERGVKLSGGQRQRVAIARAILRDAPILLLDEATSALDSESEAHIQEALWRLMAGRTALVVAHRLSTVARMDRLVVLDHGRVVESGTHQQLLDAAGLYADLWRRQSGGFLG
ncbi:MAG TPA: ABC transporter ATP-binding protein [Mycobacteriales bacterium]|nr:ABC transporter ATP-binding protein [Mycobacteriales bacterium]